MKLELIWSRRHVYEAATVHSVHYAIYMYKIEVKGGVMGMATSIGHTAFDYVFFEKKIRQVLSITKPAFCCDTWRNNMEILVGLKMISQKLAFFIVGNCGGATSTSWGAMGIPGISVHWLPEVQKRLIACSWTLQIHPRVINDVFC